MSLALRLADSADLTGQLETALSSRSTIDQAIGVVMGQERCNADDAFAVLRAASQNRHRKLRDVAAELIENRRLVQPHTGSQATALIRPRVRLLRDREPSTSVVRPDRAMSSGHARPSQAGLRPGRGVLAGTPRHRPFKFPPSVTPSDSDP